MNISNSGRLSCVLSRAAVLCTAAAVLAAIGSLGACSNKPPPRARPVQAPVLRDVPNVLRGTIGTEATLLKADPVIVSGFGLVVGLKGTGGGDLPPQIAATMERELGLMGMGRNAEALRGTAFEGRTPQQVLRSKDVAVVVVYAAVMPGAPSGMPFDVYVSSVNKSPEISLEGGTLWTTELRVGPPSTFGGYQTRHLATARGPIFINPFAEPGSAIGVGRQNGRVLAGGTVTKPLELELILDNESYTRARAITQAINGRFPPAQGAGPTARGRGAVPGASNQIISITMPTAYRDRTEEFLNTLLRIQINDIAPQEFARRYVETLKSEPYLANDLTWCLVALPQRSAVPFLRDLYDWPELAPRRAALRAGALLNDALVVPHLVEMASSGPASDRVEAIDLLSRLSGPRVDQALRDQLSARELSVRVAAYEALADRAEKMHMRRLMQQQPGMPTTIRVASENNGGLGREAQLEFQTIHGVRRKGVSGAFLLDVVPVGEPLIYVAQQGRPRVVLFGEHQELARPTLVSAWSNRLVLTAESQDSPHRLLYQEPNRIDDFGDTLPGQMTSGPVPSDLPALIELLAQRPTPEDPRPGFGLTYSEVVGVLHAFWSAGAVSTAFAVQDDLLQNRLLQAAQQTSTSERPETSSDAENTRILEPTMVPELVDPESLPVPVRQRQMVVPLEPPASRQR